MKVRTRISRSGALLTLVTVFLAACSNGPSSSGSGGSTNPSPATGGSTTTGGSMKLQTNSLSGLGTVLATSDGQTLYLLSADKGGKPMCTTSPCTGVWPPLLLPSGVMSASAGSGVNTGLLGTVSTPSGTQVTYGNWPVYTYSGDSGPGQSNGEKIQSFGGTWYAVSSSGKPAGAGSGSSTGGGW